jgi:MFS family permease
MRNARRLPSRPEVDLLIEEIDLWLERAVQDEMICGASAQEAEERVLGRYPASQSLARILADEAADDVPTGAIGRRLGRSMTASLGVLGVLHLLCVALMNVQIFMPSGKPISEALEPAVVRTFLPEPLPFPELSVPFMMWVIGMALAPIFGGIVLGCLIPGRPGLAAYRALAPLIFTNCLLGAALYPRAEPTLFALVQVLWWLPAAPASAWLAHELRRKRGIAFLSPASGAVPGSERFPLKNL